MTPGEEFALQVATMQIWDEEMRGHISHDEAMVRYELARLGYVTGVEQWNEHLQRVFDGIDQAVKPVHEEMLLVSYDQL